MSEIDEEKMARAMTQEDLDEIAPGVMGVRHRENEPFDDFQARVDRLTKEKDDYL
jgi:hypothetical protein